MSLEDADALTPQIRLSKLINTLAPSDYKTSRLIVMSPSYMKDLMNILSETPNDVLQTYFIWKTIQSFAPYIEADAVVPYKRFSNEVQGKVHL
jgi:endothelin-converting enzyme